VVIAEKMKDYPKALYAKGIRVIIAGTRRNLSDAINPQIKSLNFLNNILAKIEAKREDAYEAVMLNGSGYLTEGTISNVFFYRDEILCTPSLRCGLLEGITRGIILDLAVREGLRVREGEFSREDIHGAREVFLTNTTMEVMPVSQLDQVKYNVGDVGKLLRKAYREEVNAYVKGIRERAPSLWGYE
jgi:branched-chain amino acid aminotransferase